MARLLDRFALLQFFDRCGTQSEDSTKHLIVMRADPRRGPSCVSGRERRNSRQSVMRDFAPGLRFGFDDVAACAQMNVVKQILAG